MSRPLPQLASVVCAIFGIALLALVACGDDDDDQGAPAATGAASSSATSPPAVSGTPVGGATTASVGGGIVAGPASKYAVSQDDLVDRGYITDIRQTFVHTLKMYAATKTFRNATEGEKLLQSWGYIGGYETAYEPEEREASVLAGDYYINVEVHLFRDVAGADAAYADFTGRLKAVARNQHLEAAATVGDESSVWRQAIGRVTGSTVEAVYHRIVVRQGNLIAVISTYGAAIFMTEGPVLELAKMVDEKALGARPAMEPTPVAGTR